ncbi:MAG: hypothetical protein KDA58_16720, partial [Planctomycetaceae bacterium]|nr:hypothetical protein [Planctomycetaceae bacterium]
STANRDLTQQLATESRDAQVDIGTAQIGAQARIARAAVTEAENLVDDEAAYADDIADAQQDFTKYPRLVSRGRPGVQADVRRVSSRI